MPDEPDADPCPPVGGVVAGEAAAGVAVGTPFPPFADSFVGGVLVGVGAAGVAGVVLDSAHTPLSHTPLGQTVPHAPQLFGSLLRSAHKPPHMTVGKTQPISTWTEEQNPPSQMPIGQAAPQPPQFCTLVSVSTSQPSPGVPLQSL